MRRKKMTPLPKKSVSAVLAILSAVLLWTAISIKHETALF